jgi:nucleoside-diphosphate-sugar epimerase
MKILVTGGGGFLGQALCAALKKRGYEVTSFQRTFSSALEKMGVQQTLGDLANRQAVMDACKNHDAVFHNAAKAGAWGSYKSYYDANVIGTDNVLAACREHGIKKLVYTSTPSVTHAGRTPVEGGNEINTAYGENFKAPYPATKTIAERNVIAADSSTLATVSLRPRLIWGPGDTQLLPRLVERAKAGRLKFIAGGFNKMDTTYIDNVVHAHLQAFDHLDIGSACAGKAYFISNGEPKPVRETVNALLNVANVPQVTGSIPYGLAYRVGAVLEMLWQVLPLKGEPPMTRFLAEQLSTPHWYDISAARRDFDYVPQVSTEEGLRRLRVWWEATQGNRK